jgi:hypothetical protein
MKVAAESTAVVSPIANSTGASVAIRASSAIRPSAGGACRVRVEPNKARCRFHGGLSTALLQVRIALVPERGREA